MAKNPLAQAQKLLNKTFASELPQGYKIRLCYIGSFVSLRVNDLDGRLTLCLFQSIVNAAYAHLRELGQPLIEIPGNLGYHMGGCVKTWGIH